MLALYNIFVVILHKVGLIQKGWHKSIKVE